MDHEFPETVGRRLVPVDPADRARVTRLNDIMVSNLLRVFGTLPHRGEARNGRSVVSFTRSWSAAYRIGWDYFGIFDDHVMPIRFFDSLDDVECAERDGDDIRPGYLHRFSPHRDDGWFLEISFALHTVPPGTASTFATLGNENSYVVRLRRPQGVAQYPYDDRLQCRKAELVGRGQRVIVPRLELPPEEFVQKLVKFVRAVRELRGQ